MTAPVDIYSDGLAGDLVVRYSDGLCRSLPVNDWTAAADDGDRSLLERCSGPTLDVGCGPGRLLVALGERGIPALGVDITPAAVRMARARGGLALPRSVFAPVPGTGRWTTALLADGNIGIGGDPVVLLRRLYQLLATGGQVLVELDDPGARTGPVMVRLESGGRCSDWFRWAHVLPADLPDLAAAAHLDPLEHWEADGRRFASLVRR